MKITREQAKVMVSLYKDGNTTDEIAKNFEVSPAAVGYHLKANGIKMRRRGATIKELAPNADHKSVIRDYKNGMRLDEMEVKHKIFNVVIYKILDKNKVPRRRAEYVT